ncbi:MAG: hypothetical protein JST67_03950 [Bacteroidetes bacterium]|nr:hypothetical protein [Bacteroidota bacterium]
MKDIVVFLLCIPFIAFGVHKEPSKKQFFFVNSPDSALKQKINFSLNIDFFTPQIREKQTFFNINAPNVGHQILLSAKDYLNIYSFRFNPFTISIISGFKLYNKFYFNVGIMFNSISEKYITSGDSIKIYSGQILNTIYAKYQYKNLTIPTGIEFRANKHFIISFNVYSSVCSWDKIYYLTPELFNKSSLIKRKEVSIFFMQSIGVSTHLCHFLYLNLGIVHGALDDKSIYSGFIENLYYSAGLKILF